LEGFDDSYPKNIHEQLKLHLGKAVKIQAAGRTKTWKGVLLHVGLDYVELGQIARGEVWKRQYFLLNQIIFIEPDE
jgi:hypothetical protein